MIIFKQQDILEIDVEAIINTVNIVGVMGKVLHYNLNKNILKILKLTKKLVKMANYLLERFLLPKTNNMLNPKYIINFPTKEHWKSPSKIEYIIDGLKDLKNFIRDKDIKFIAIPSSWCR